VQIDELLALSIDPNLKLGMDIEQTIVDESTSPGQWATEERPALPAAMDWLEHFLTAYTERHPAAFGTSLIS
jgi:hypothetical protein